MYTRQDISHYTYCVRSGKQKKGNWIFRMPIQGKFKCIYEMHRRCAHYFAVNEIYEKELKIHLSIRKARWRIIYYYLLPLAEAWFLLDDVFGNGSTTITLWCCPFDFTPVLVVILDLWGTRLSWGIYKTIEDTIFTYRIPLFKGSDLKYASVAPKKNNPASQIYR